MYIIYDTYYGELDRVTEKELRQLKAMHPGRYTIIGKE